MGAIMPSIRRANLFASLVLLTGCAVGPPPTPQNLVSVGSIIMSSLCGMVAAHKNGPAGATLNNQSVSLELELKIASCESGGVSLGGSANSSCGSSSGGGSGSGGGGSGTGKSGSGSTASTGVLSFSGLGLTPSLSLGANSGWTVDTFTTLTIQMPPKPNSYDPDVAQYCQAKLVKEGGDQFGFVRWLGDTLPGIASASQLSIAGNPSKALSLEYEANFGVTYNASGGITVIPVTVPIPIGVAGAYSQNDVQALTINIGKPPSKTSQPGGSIEEIQKFFAPAAPAGAPKISLAHFRHLPE
jgi:hypothetical protein